MNYKHILLALISIALLGSCASTKQIAYFQDLQPNKSQLEISSSSNIKIASGDKLSIIVNSKDPALANLFNLPIVSRQIGQTGATGNSSQGISGYTVDQSGNIDFPVVGSVHVAEMTREQIAQYVKKMLIAQNLIKDPVVTVDFMNLTVSVLGEVASPGRYNIDKDKITLLDAIGMAGDLTINGKRNNVTVLREENGVQHVYGVNLCSASDLFASPVYYLQQDDIVYVEPNATKARQSTVNGNVIRSASFWISLASLLTTVTVLVVK